jgi:hypothetical protein
MAGTTLDIEYLVDPDDVAREISQKWIEWDDMRSGWVKEKKELRDYVYATDTSTTSNSKKGWFNSTTTPKLTQIYDNLKANYTAALFPNSKWMKWEADSREGAMKAKKDVIQAYMDNKLRQSKFTLEADKLVDDFILFGNCFATVEFETNYNEVGENEVIPGYIGPRIRRISPYDIVFNPTAPSFSASPKVIRSIVTLGELEKAGKYEDVLDKLKYNRREVAGADVFDKSDGFVADGFSDIQRYYGSGYVEILTFYGDLFDIHTGELKASRKITIVDRAYVIEDEPVASWLGKEPVFHSGWRNRPDNLWAMGPLDNLVGMQYRIDHLENLKADIFDQIALPLLKVQGQVEDFEYKPGERIVIGEEGNVDYLHPDATALNADMQIQLIENKMEEFAGAPRQAMGIRTPGEKTAFEVSTLENSASRIFQHKAAKFEKEFLEPILNAMLESARRNMNNSDVIRVLDDPTGAILFKEITREDIAAKGQIVPMGARHFAESAQRLQNLVQIAQIKADPTVAPHLSGKVYARLIAEELGEEELFGENIAIEEQMETQQAANDAEADMQEQMQIAAEEGL